MGNNCKTVGGKKRSLKKTPLPSNRVLMEPAKPRLGIERYCPDCQKFMPCENLNKIKNHKCLNEKEISKLEI